MPVCTRDYRWKCFFVWFDNRTRYGAHFPVLVFLTHRHGGIKNIFNGYRWLRDCAGSRWQAPAARPVVRPQRCAVQQDDAWRAARFQALHQCFPRLAREWGGHAYLARKLGDWAPAVCARMELRRGADERGDFIAAPLYRDQCVVGYQRIYDRPIAPDGRDREYVMSAAGMKRGASARIRGMDGSAEAALAEGIATAMSVALCRRGDVYIGLDAGNLPHVAAALRHRPLEILADNDCWHPARGNAGLDKAREAQRAHGSASLRVPRFPRGVQSHRPTDFNDLLCLAGLPALQAQLGGGEPHGEVLF